MIPTALTIVGARLPPGQRPLGIALFGMTAVLGPVLGPVLGGWLTQNLSWHHAFFMNLPIGIGLLCLVTIGLPGRKARFEEFLTTDVPGIAGLVLGLGGLTVVLEEGQRERWFESRLICELSVVSVLGIGLLILGQFVSKKPVIQLKILLNRAFGGVFVMSLMVGAALYGILYIIPQFLTAVSGYNAQQSGEIAAISGLPTLMLLAVFPILVRVIDIRIAVAFGFVLYGVSCFMDIHLSPEAAGPQFVDSQILRGVAQFFAMLFLNQAATSAVSRDLMEDASGLFNAARNLGGSFGLAMVATLQDQRQTFHEARIAESLPANSIAVQTATHTLGLARSERGHGEPSDGDDLFGSLLGVRRRHVRPDPPGPVAEAVAQGRARRRGRMTLVPRSLLRRAMPTLAVAAMAAELSACMVGPDYKGPPTMAPIALETGSFHRADAAPVAADPPPARWWLALNDAELTRLIEQAFCDSPNLKAAAAKVRNARAMLREQGAKLLPSGGASAAALSIKPPSSIGSILGSGSSAARAGPYRSL